MTECVPHFEFAPKRTHTVGDAVCAANKGYTSHFGGKWHLGSFYNDSEAYGGLTSLPVTHGFDHFNATVEGDDQLRVQRSVAGEQRLCIWPLRKAAWGCGLLAALRGRARAVS